MLLMGVPSPPFRLGQLLVRVEEGWKRGSHPQGDRAGPASGGSLGVGGCWNPRARPTGGDRQSSPVCLGCPWDRCSLEGPAGGPCVVTALSGVPGLLPGAVWLPGAACPEGATSSCHPAWPLPCSPVLGPPSPGPGPVELPAGVPVLLRGLPCVEDSFGDAHLRRDPWCSRPAQSTARASENKSPARRRALPAAGEAEPAPNPIPGPAGGGGEGEKREGLSWDEASGRNALLPSTPHPRAPLGAHHSAC